jgi:hypothetical protein
MATKKTKLWLIIVSIPVVLVLAGVIFLKIYFSGDRLKTLVVPKVENALNKKVEIKDISLSIFPTFGVELSGLRISSVGGNEFEKSDFVSLDELLLDVNIFALFKNSVEVNEVIIRRPHIYFEVNAAGAANYKVPGDTTASQTDKKDSLKIDIGKQQAILLSNFQIVDGNFEYLNKLEGKRIVVRGVNQKTRVETSPATMVVTLNSELEVGGINFGTPQRFLFEDVPLKVKQTISYDRKNDVLSLDSITVALKDIVLFMNGRITTTQTKPNLDIKLSNKSSELSHLLSLLPKEVLKSAEGLSTSGKFAFSMTIKGTVADSSQPNIRGNFSLVDGTIKYAQLPKSITGINVLGAFEKTQNTGSLSLEKINLNLGSNLVAGKLSINDFDNPTLNAYFKGSVSLSQVGEFYPLEKGTMLGGTIFSDILVSGKVKVPTSIKASGKIEFRDVSMATATSPKPVKNLSGIINFNNQFIETKQLTMNIGESDLKLAFLLKNYLALVMQKAAEAGKPSASITLTSNRLRTSDLVADSSKTEKGTGEKVKTAALPLPNVDVDANIDVKKFSTDKFDFENARGSIKYSDGIVNLKNFSVNAFQGNVLTTGMLDMRKPEIRPFDLKLDVAGVEANSFLTKFTSFGSNLFGKFTMNTSLKGSLDDTLGIISKSLQGGGKVQVFDGKLTGYPIMAKISEFTGLNEFHQVDFKNWSNAFAVSNSRINIKDLKINSLNSDLTVNGSQGFDGTLNYLMGIKLPASASDRLKVGGTGGQVLNLLKDKDGRIVLNLLIGGILNKPSVGLDTKEQQKQLENIVRQQIGNKIQEETKKILQDSSKQNSLEDLKKKAKDQLKNLFKK